MDPSALAQEAAKAAQAGEAWRALALVAFFAIAVLAAVVVYLYRDRHHAQIPPKAEPHPQPGKPDSDKVRAELVALRAEGAHAADLRALREAASKALADLDEIKTKSTEIASALEADRAILVTTIQRFTSTIDALLQVSDADYQRARKESEPTSRRKRGV